MTYMETYYPAHVAFATPVTLPGGEKVKVGLIRRGVQTRDWKYVKSEPHPVIDVEAGSLPEVPEELAASLVREELFDLAAAAGEKRNVVRQHPEVVGKMRELLQRHLEAERAPVPSVPAGVDPETRLRLKSLGYDE
jgi:hypothetical protein